MIWGQCSNKPKLLTAGNTIWILKLEVSTSLKLIFSEYKKTIPTTGPSAISGLTVTGASFESLIWAGSPPGAGRSQHGCGAKSKCFNATFGSKHWKNRPLVIWRSNEKTRVEKLQYQWKWWIFQFSQLRNTCTRRDTPHPKLSSSGVSRYFQQMSFSDHGKHSCTCMYWSEN